MKGRLSEFGNESLVIGLEALRALELPYSILDHRNNNVSRWDDARLGRISFSSSRKPHGLDVRLKGRTDEPYAFAAATQLGRRLMPRLLAEPSLAVYKLHTSRRLDPKFSPCLDESKTFTVFQKFRGEERLGDAEVQLRITRQMRESDRSFPVHLDFGFVQVVREIDLFADIVGRRIDQLSQETLQVSK